MAIDTQTKRRSVHGYNNTSRISPVPDGTVAASDRKHVGGLYSGISSGGGGGTTLITQVGGMFRFVHSRIFGRVN